MAGKYHNDWVEILNPGAQEEAQVPLPEVRRPTPFVDSLYDAIDSDEGPSFRSDGLHVSDLHYLCPRREVLQHWFPKEPEVQKRGERATFVLTVKFGEWTHNGFQCEFLSWMKHLWGTWKCSRCFHRIEEIFAPTSPCPRCGWAWHGECQETCVWPGGFGEGSRNCLKCCRWGRWEYQEPKIHVKEMGLVGSSDGIIIPPYLNGEWAVLEMKTITARRSPWLKRPFPGHETQVQVYRHELRKHYPKITQAVVVYIHKGEYRKEDRPIEFWLAPDDALVERVYKRAETVRGIRAAGYNVEVTYGHPERVCPSEKNWYAKRCPWCAECYDKGIGERIARVQRLRENKA